MDLALAVVVSSYVRVFDGSAGSGARLMGDMQ
jgi:hypothetical protein